MWDVGPLDSWGNFLRKEQVNSDDIICNVNGRPVPTNTRVAAGNDVKVEWEWWPEIHWGIILAYMANCNGPCQEADKTQLKWFKIYEEGMLEDSTSPPNGPWLTGRWATDAFWDNGNVASVTVPMVKSGFWLMRFEIIALHQASSDGAQLYPYCINLDVTGDGTLDPPGILGTELYSPDDEGLSVNIYVPLGTYPMVGPPLFDGAASGSSALEASPGSSNSTGSTGSSDMSDSTGSTDSSDVSGSTGSSDTSDSTGSTDSSDASGPTGSTDSSDMSDSTGSTGSYGSSDSSDSSDPTSGTPTGDASGADTTTADAAGSSPTASSKPAKKYPRRACKAYYD